MTDIHTPPANRKPAPTRRGTRPVSAGVTAAMRKGTARLAAVSDRLQLSTFEKLKEGNRKALAVAANSLSSTVTKPLETLKGIGKGIADLLLRPGKAFASVAERFAKDPVDGVVGAANMGASYAGLASAAMVAVAFLAGPFTGGASLALLPLAGTLGSAAGITGLAALGASFAKNQVDIASAETRQELDKEANELGADYANAGVQVITMAAGKALHKGAEALKPKNINPSSVQRAYDVVADKVREKLAKLQAEHGGVRTTDMSLAEIRAEGIAQVQEAVDWSVQGKRQLSVIDVDRGSFDMLDHVGERHMTFHGTRQEVRDLIIANGFRPSDIGDFGSGVYLGTSPKTGLVYADDVTFARSTGVNAQPVVFTAEVATGKVLDFLAEKDTFLKWAMEHMDPKDLADPINQLYESPSVPLNPFVDNTYTRFLPRYAKEMGYDSILVRNAEGLGKDFWVVHDPNRVLIRQAISVEAPTNRELFPSTIDGRIVGAVNQARQESERP
jgi:hypothetical protein